MRGLLEEGVRGQNTELGPERWQGVRGRQIMQGLTGRASDLPPVRWYPVVRLGQQSWDGKAGFNKIALAAVLRTDSGGHGGQSSKAAGRS